MPFRFGGDAVHVYLTINSWFEGDEARFVSLMPSTGRIRKELDSLKGGETVEFIGRPCEWHDMSGQNYYIVIVIDIVILPKRQNA